MGVPLDLGDGHASHSVWLPAHMYCSQQQMDVSSTSGGELQTVTCMQVLHACSGLPGSKRVCMLRQRPYCYLAAFERCQHSTATVFAQCMGIQGPDIHYAAARAGAHAGLQAWRLRCRQAAEFRQVRAWRAARALGWHPDRRASCNARRKRIVCNASPSLLLHILL